MTLLQLRRWNMQALDFLAGTQVCTAEHDREIALATLMNREPFGGRPLQGWEYLKRKILAWKGGK